MMIVAGNILDKFADLPIFLSARVLCVGVFTVDASAIADKQCVFKSLTAYYFTPKRLCFFMFTAHIDIT
jgi:hypothetical protein